jgi:uncharacterized protein
MASVKELMLAIQIGAKDQVIDMLDADPALINANAGHKIPMALMALYYRQPEIAEIFAQRGAKLNIFAATGLGKLERVKQLVQQDPSCINAFAGDGFQPIGLAAFFGQEAVVRLLISMGAEVNSPSQNPMQVRPIHSAAAGRHLGVLAALLEAGADPNARQADEFVPLHAAAQNGDVEMVSLLLAHGADPSLKTSDGRDALTFARQSGSQGVIEILSNYSKTHSQNNTGF